MNVLRPVRSGDLDAVFELAALTKAGLTTLPHDRELLSQRIHESERSFEFPPDKPGGELFFFVLEALATGRIIGTCSIVSKVGGFQPFWTYQILSLTNRSKLLGVNKKIQVLQLKADHNGPTEIGTLFLDPAERQGHNGRLLSLSRFVFMARHRHCCEDTVIAEMRGAIDDDGRTVFWEALGKHFFAVDFAKADLMVMKDKSFIQELMPKHPIYIPLLPKEAQLVIGEVHPETRPARRLLEQEGFRFCDEIDIFEAGPVLNARTDEIRTVKACRTLTLAEVRPVTSSRLYILANGRDMKSFRALAGEAEFSAADQAALSEETCRALDLHPGDPLLAAPLRREPKR